MPVRETCFARCTRMCWDAKHISTHVAWRRVQQGGGVLSCVGDWPTCGRLNAARIHAGMRIARSASKHTRQALHGRHAHRQICKQAYKAGITRQACASPDLQASTQGRHYTAGMRIARSASKHTRQALHGRHAHRPICKQAYKAGITRQVCASPDLHVIIVAGIQGRCAHRPICMLEL